MLDRLPTILQNGLMGLQEKLKTEKIAMLFQAHSAEFDYFKMIAKIQAEIRENINVYGYKYVCSAHNVN